MPQVIYLCSQDDFCPRVKKMKEILRRSNPYPFISLGAGKTVLKYDILILGGILVGPWVNLAECLILTGPLVE